jgi:hypothetical protein
MLPGTFSDLKRMFAGVVNKPSVVTTATLPFPKVGLTLVQIKHFIDSIGGIDSLNGMSTDDVCRMYVKPITSPLNMSYCEYLMSEHNPTPTEVKTATVFVSHAWRFMFVDVVNALNFHFRHEPDKTSINW